MMIIADTAITYFAASRLLSNGRKNHLDKLFQTKTLDESDRITVKCCNGLDSDDYKIS